jgi:hypothetical protein
MSKRILPRWLAAGAAVAWLLGAAGGARGQLSIHLEGGHRPEASIRFGSVPPRRVVPVVPPGSVRYEHYYDRDRHWERDRDHFARPAVVAPPYPVAYRNPYRVEYVRRFRPGWRPIVVGSTQYYVYPALPPACQPVVVGGVTYYLADGVYYQPYLYEGQTVYMVVPPPLP